MLELSALVSDAVNSLTSVFTPQQLGQALAYFVLYLVGLFIERFQKKRRKWRRRVKKTPDPAL
jgi:hypothetical protein